MLVRKAYKFRIYPNKEQQAALAVQFGHTRFVYNRFLFVRQKYYQQTGEGLDYRQTAGRLTEMKRNAEYEWLREGDSQVLQQALKDLDRTYQNFFAKRAGYPRYKRKASKQSIRYPQRVKIDLVGRWTYLPKVGWVKTVYHRQLEGEIKNVTVSKTKSGRYYAAFQVELECPDPVYSGGVNGLDLGLRDFAALSDGRKIANPRHLIKADKRLRRSQRQLSRKQKGSRGREKQRVLVARQHEKAADQRADFHHKLSRGLAEEHRILVVEDLHVKGMVRNRRLARHISDAGWGQFIGMLDYKGQWYGCRVEKVDRWYPSTKTCSACGAKKETVPLHIRSWVCPVCGREHDRDVNAAKNILDQTTVGTTGSYAGGVHVRPALVQAGTKKPEAQQLAAG